MPGMSTALYNDTFIISSTQIHYFANGLSHGT